MQRAFDRDIRFAFRTGGTRRRARQRFRYRNGNITNEFICRAFGGVIEVGGVQFIIVVKRQVHRPVYDIAIGATGVREFGNQM